FANHRAPPSLSPLSLHDALPISSPVRTPVGRPERIPVARGLVFAFEDEEPPALAEAGGRRPLNVRDDPIDDRLWERAVLEAPDHLPLAHDLLELHQSRRYVFRSRRTRPASTRYRRSVAWSP